MYSLLKATVPVIAATSLLLSNCSILDTRSEGAFPWVTDGRTFVYDFHLVQDTTIIDHGQQYDDRDSALTVVLYADGRSFGMGVGTSWSHLIGEVDPGILGLQGLHTEKGLEQRVRRNCDDVLNIRPFYYVRVPASPVRGNVFPEYTCDQKVIGTLTVEDTNVRMSLPVGEYTAFTLKNEESTRLEYWSKSDGLVRVELFQLEGAMLGYYELAEVYM